MAYPYDLKVVVSGKQVEVFKYTKHIWREFKKAEVEPQIKIPKQLNLFEQMDLKKQKMKFAVNRAKTEIRRLANSNPQLNKFMTLTFAENITELKTANYLFNKFILRMSYKYADFEYLAVPEFQKRGAVHYHLICNLPFVETDGLQSMWRHGFVKINKIDSIKNVGAYISKYLGKDFLDTRTFGKKSFFARKLLKNQLKYWAGLPFNLSINFYRFFRLCLKKHLNRSGRERLNTNHIRLTSFRSKQAFLKNRFCVRLYDKRKTHN